MVVAGKITIIPQLLTCTLSFQRPQNMHTVCANEIKNWKTSFYLTNF
jgi:hypothetical protein